MADSKISYQDAGLDYLQASRCEAYTILGADALSMLAVDDSGTVTAAVYYPFLDGWADVGLQGLRNVLQSDDVFRLRFRNHFCAVFHPRFTMVPDRLFRSDNLPAYFHLLLKDNNMQYGYNRIAEMDCVAVYAHREEERDVCLRLSGRDTAPHLAPAFLRSAQYISPTQSASVVVNVRNKIAQVAVFDRQHLHYYNAVPFDGVGDLVYYTMLLFEQFRLNQQTTALLLAGNVNAGDEMVRLFRTFVAKVSFAQSPEKLQFPILSQEVPEHFFFELISLRHFGR